MSEFLRFGFDIAASSSTSEFQELELVGHVTHLRKARRIIEDGIIRAGLVYDESRLNTSRLSVVWLSANTWANGSLYGNVKFSIPWSKLVGAENKFYWVEAMESYRPTAYRILITDRDRSSSRKLTPYCPKSDHGPLRFINNKWYWRSDYTSEFLFEKDITLNSFSELRFIDHHARYRSEFGSNCSERELGKNWISGRLIAYILARGLHEADDLIKIPSKWRESKLSDSFDLGINAIRRTLASDVNFGGQIEDPKQIKSIAIASLLLFGQDNEKQAIKLIRLIRERKLFEECLQGIVERHFDVQDWTFEQ